MGTLIKLGVIGDPIDHSLSPKMFSAVISHFSLGATYEPIRIPRDNIEALEPYLNGDFSGFNVTVPHKKSVLKYCDDLTKEAKDIGAVNTLFRRQGKWVGHNSDAYGFRKLLEKTNPS